MPNLLGNYGICLLRVISMLSSQIMRLLSFITFNISSIEGNIWGRRNNLPKTLMGSLSLSKVKHIEDICYKGCGKTLNPKLALGRGSPSVKYCMYVSSNEQLQLMKHAILSSKIIPNLPPYNHHTAS